MQAGKTRFLETFHQIDFNEIQKHPNILIAARFWGDERYGAARTCYKFMRAIDDFIDGQKSIFINIPVAKRAYFARQVKKWLVSVRSGVKADPDRAELLLCMEQYGIPYSFMEDFAEAMLYDIGHDGFRDFESFARYSMGASVAPSSIFVHLCGLQRGEHGWLPPLFDVREAALPCAMFSYLVHIIRDFQKDQIENLSYFADDRILAHGLTRCLLRAIAGGAPVPQGFRSLIREYLDHAEGYRIKTLETIERISPLVDPGARLSLKIIYDLYLMVYERIDPEGGSFTTQELNPTHDEIRNRVLRTIMQEEEVTCRR